MKFCKKCERDLPIDSFGKRSASPDGKMYECKECVIKKAVKWAKENPKKFKETQKKYLATESAKRYKKNWRLQNSFGISLDEYEKMCANQYNKCAICAEEVSLNVDHCHSNGHIRGLLCGCCNRAIGLLRDDVKILQSAINYLSK
jgi:hypothetical protein